MSNNPGITKPIILAYMRDLFFGVRVRDVVERLGGLVQMVEKAEEITADLPEAPVLTVVEIGPANQENWQAVIRRVRQLFPRAPILAFGSHQDIEAHRVARQAGCDQVWARSRFTQALPTLMQAYLRPQPEVHGCDDAPSMLVRRGLELFNKGAYFECHEVLEEVWFAETRPCRVLYQGILQLAVALYHIENGNFYGAAKMFPRAIEKFQRLPAKCQGVDVAGLLQQSLLLQQTLHMLGPGHMDEFPRALIPHIHTPF
jgi:predicted metal-dependent hydrolase